MSCRSILNSYLWPIKFSIIEIENKSTKEIESFSIKDPAVANRLGIVSKVEEAELVIAGYMI